MLKILIN